MGMEILASSPPTEFYLDRLNDAQRRAVLHGDGQVADFPRAVPENSSVRD